MFEDEVLRLELLWAGFFSNNRVVFNGMFLKFVVFLLVDGKFIAKFNRDEFEKFLEIW